MGLKDKVKSADRQSHSVIYSSIVDFFSLGSNQLTIRTTTHTRSQRSNQLSHENAKLVLLGVGYQLCELAITVGVDKVALKVPSPLSFLYSTLNVPEYHVEKFWKTLLSCYNQNQNWAPYLSVRHINRKCQLMGHISDKHVHYHFLLRACPVLITPSPSVW